MLQDLIFIKNNQNLKEHFDSDNLIDHVVMNDDIDTNNIWLLGGEDEAQPSNNDMVFDGDDLSWLYVEIASGGAESTAKQHCKRRKLCLHHLHLLHLYLS